LKSKNFFDLNFRAGLQEKDIIVEVNGKTLSSAQQLTDCISSNVSRLNIVVVRGDSVLGMTIIPEDVL